MCRQKYDIPPYSYAKSNRQVALVLLHSDWAITNAEPLAPHIVSVGPLTAAPAKALPPDLEEFVQSAGDQGVVYAIPGMPRSIQLPPQESSCSPSNLLQMQVCMCAGGRVYQRGSRQAFLVVRTSGGSDLSRFNALVC